MSRVAQRRSSPPGSPAPPAAARATVRGNRFGPCSGSPAAPADRRAAAPRRSRCPPCGRAARGQLAADREPAPPGPARPRHRDLGLLVLGQCEEGPGRARARSLSRPGRSRDRPPRRTPRPGRRGRARTRRRRPIHLRPPAQRRRSRAHPARVLPSRRVDRRSGGSHGLRRVRRRPDRQHPARAAHRGDRRPGPTPTWCWPSSSTSTRAAR